MLDCIISSDLAVKLPGLAALGFSIGCLTGIFGVGGGFLLVPLMNIVFGIPYNIAVGSGLAQMVGSASSSAIRHIKLGNVDYKLGIILAAGSFFGAEIGVRLQERLQRLSSLTVNGREISGLDFYMTVFFIILLLCVGVLMFLETSGKKAVPGESGGSDEVSTSISRKLQSLRISPMTGFETAGLSRISIWIPLLSGLFIGIFSGILGIGGAFLLLPLLIYAVGVPTSVAVGTGAFQVIFTTVYGSIRHAMQGNVDCVIVIALMTGGIIGAQLGALATKKIKKTKLRRYFTFVIFLGVTVISYNFVRKLWF